MTYDDHRAALMQYLKAKVDICDWHAVADAAMDLRELEAREDAQSDAKESPLYEELRHALNHIRQCDETRLCSDCGRLAQTALSHSRK